MRPVALLTTLLLFASLQSIGIPAMAEETKVPMRTISVTASGQVTAVPDIVRISTGVLAEATTAKEALSANTAAMSQVVEKLKALGLDAKDIQTSDFSVQPKYLYPQDGTPPKLTGYQVSNMVHIRVRNVARMGEVLDQVVDAGSNQVHGIQFEVSKADELQDSARKNAFAAALRKAQLYAAAAGAMLGPVISISEGPVQQGPVPVMRQAMTEKADAVPIEAGEQALEVQVSVVWALQ